MTRASRRDFLKLAGTLAAAAALPSGRFSRPRLQADWPAGPEVRLGRVVWPWGTNIVSRPHPEGRVRGKLLPDEVIRIQRDVVGRGLAAHNHVWHEVEGGYVYSPHLQPVQNLPQTPLQTLPAEGVWAEVCVPYVDALARPEPDAPVVYRLYYSAVFKITELHPQPDGAVWYRAYTETERRMYVPAQVLRVIAPEELAPLAPRVDPRDKRLVVSLRHQTLSAFEGQAEVFRARIASGAQFFGEDGVTLTSGTPRGAHSIWSKRYSRHMQGGTLQSGYDLPGVGWVCYFGSNGAALHSTYWHNDFGIPKSHGCLNCRPEDARWIFRWTAPQVDYQPGDLIVNWVNRGTVVDIQVGA